MLAISPLLQLCGSLILFENWNLNLGFHIPRMGNQNKTLEAHRPNLFEGECSFVPDSQYYMLSDCP